jgi:predicted Zn-dependent protease
MKDKIRIEKAFYQLKQSKLPFWLIIFPEGFILLVISTLTLSNSLDSQQNFESRNPTLQKETSGESEIRRITQAASVSTFIISQNQRIRWCCEGSSVCLELIFSHYFSLTFVLISPLMNKTIHSNLHIFLEIL